jgi:hypothetical protein
MVRTNAVALEDLPRRRMEVPSGLAAGVPWCACTATLWLPSVDGDRIWLLEFRGIVVLLVMAQDGSVGASLPEPAAEVPRSEALQRAVRRALDPFLRAAPRPRGIPGGLHRIGIEIEQKGPAGRKCRVRVRFDETELCSEQREIDNRAAPVLRLLPSQAMGVAAVEFRGTGP